MGDIFDKCQRFLDGPKLLDAEKRELAVSLFSEVSPPDNAGPWAGSNGRKLLQFSTNDYLGLAMHPEVRAAAARIVGQYGIGAPMGSRLMTGTTQAHLELEEAIARFKRTDGAVTFTSGALAMMGSIACLAGPQDILLLDEHAHASLVCGAKISTAEIHYFRHNDLDQLKTLLAACPASKAVAIVVDGVYSMQGDTAPLAELVDLKRRYHARLIVDDAHGTGVFGQEGRGTAAHYGVEAEVDLHAGTFSKALGTAGGFIAADRATVEFIRYNAPTFIFTKAMPLAVVAATCTSLGLLQAADSRRTRLWENRRRLQAGLVARGFQIGATQSPITPIEFHGADALYAARELRRCYGIWASPVIYPAVPMGRSILRVIPTAMHSDSDVDYLIEAIAKIRAAVILGSLARV